MRIEFTRRTADQVRAATEWWRANRSKAPGLFVDELEHALELLTLDPPRAQVFAEIESKVVRRVEKRRRCRSMTTMTAVTTFFLLSRRGLHFDRVLEPRCLQALLDRQSD